MYTPSGGGKPLPKGLRPVPTPRPGPKPQSEPVPTPTTPSPNGPVPTPEPVPPLWPWEDEYEQWKREWRRVHVYRWWFHEHWWFGWLYPGWVSEWWEFSISPEGTRVYEIDLGFPYGGLTTTGGNNTGGVYIKATVDGSYGFEIYDPIHAPPSVEPNNMLLISFDNTVAMDIYLEGDGNVSIDNVIAQINYQTGMFYEKVESHGGYAFDDPRYLGIASFSENTNSQVVLYPISNNAYTALGLEQYTQSISSPKNFNISATQDDIILT